MGFLAEIVRETRAAVGRPDYLSSLGPPRPRPSSGRFRRAVDAAGGDGALIVEFKRVSPGSEAPRLPVRSAPEFVRRTEPGGVAAYSCVASIPRFDGAPADVAAVVEATPRPVLFKDFVVDPRQLDAAAQVGADAVLLIARLESEGLLTDSLATLAAGAHARGLGVLLEFHDRTELKLAASVAADMYGVNVRNLDTLRMEPRVADATIAAAGGLRPLLGLSGVATPSDARRLWDAGVDGILVGSSVARASDPGRFLQSLHRTRARESP